VDHVTDRPAEQRHVPTGSTVTRVVCQSDLGQRATQHVDHRHGLRQARPAVCAGEHDQFLGVTPPSGWQVVDPEQLGEFLGVCGATLHRIEQAQLPVQQGLAAPGKAEEDVAYAAAQLGLLDGDPDRGLLTALKAWLTCQISSRPKSNGGASASIVDPLAVLQPFHHPRQPIGGEFEGGTEQALQLAHQVPSGGDEMTMDAMTAARPSTPARIRRGDGTDGGRFGPGPPSRPPRSVRGCGSRSAPGRRRHSRTTAVTGNLSGVAPHAMMVSSNPLNCRYVSLASNWSSRVRSSPDRSARTLTVRNQPGADQLAEVWPGPRC